MLCQVSGEIERSVLSPAVSPGCQVHRQNFMGSDPSQARLQRPPCEHGRGGTAATGIGVDGLCLKILGMVPGVAGA